MMIMLMDQSFFCIFLDFNLEGLINLKMNWIERDMICLEPFIEFERFWANCICAYRFPSLKYICWVVVIPSCSTNFNIVKLTIHSKVFFIGTSYKAHIVETGIWTECTRNTKFESVESISGFELMSQSMDFIVRGTPISN